jgi:hypothetical protein
MFLHLLRVPLPVGLAKIPTWADLLPQPREQQCFVGVNQVRPQGDTLVRRKVVGDHRLHPRASDQLVRHDRLLS